MLVVDERMSWKWSDLEYCGSRKREFRVPRQEKSRYRCPDSRQITCFAQGKSSYTPDRQAQGLPAGLVASVPFSSTRDKK